MKIRQPYCEVNKLKTDRNIPNCKPDIINCNDEKGTCILIDVAISWDGNMINKEAKKIFNYKDLTTYTQGKWNV
jgi:hypothetical protein